MEKILRVSVAIVFLVAYGSFLWASLHHIAFFFANFEPVDVDMTGSYALAISIDVTSLVLTISMMFSQRNMGKWTKIGVWGFIFGLTAFSWLVNWEYAVIFEHPQLMHVGIVSFINPILASSFAFLNLAYSVVAERFTAKVKTIAELETYAKELEDKKAVQQRIKHAKKGTGIMGFVATTYEEYQEVKERFSSHQKPEENHLKMHTNMSGKPMENDEKRVSKPDTIREGKTDTITPQTIVSCSPVSQRSLSIQEAALLLEITENRVRTLIKNKRLKVSPRNPKKILMSSIKSYQNTLVKSEKNDDQNGHHYDALNELITIASGE